MSREQILWAIRQFGFADAYLNKIASDTFKRSRWQSLELEELRKLRMTVKARARSLRKRSNPAG